MVEKKIDLEIKISQLEQSIKILSRMCEINKEFHEIVNRTLPDMDSQIKKLTENQLLTNEALKIFGESLSNIEKELSEEN